MTKPLFKFLVLFVLNGFALFGAVIGLYFFLAQYHLNAWLHLLIVLFVGTLWAVKSMGYFRDEFAKLIGGEISKLKK